MPSMRPGAPFMPPSQSLRSPQGPHGIPLQAGGASLPPWITPSHAQAFPRPAAPQPRPISSKAIPGTDWLEVINNNSTRFWHNTKTNVGVWQMPPEVRAAGKAPPPLDPKRAKMLERAMASGAVVAPKYEAVARRKIQGQLMLQGPSGGSKKRRAEGPPAEATPVEEVYNKQEDDDDEFDVTFTEDEVAGEEPPQKLETTAPGVVAGGLQPTSSPSNEESNPIAVPKKNVAEGSFRALLSESGIHGFSRYEREAPKLQSDSRFIAVQPPERRRALFEEYCAQAGMPKKKRQGNDKEGKQQSGGASSLKTSAAPKQRLKSGGGGAKAAEDAFRALLQVRVLRSDSRWHRTKEDLRSDPRYNALGEERREALFRAHVDSLWKVEEARERAERRAQHEHHAAVGRRRQVNKYLALRNYQIYYCFISIYINTLSWFHSPLQCLILPIRN